MKLTEGYKKTEVGAIPQDWTVESLASVTPRNRPNGIVDGPFGSNLKTIHYRVSGVPIITSGYVTDGTFSATSYLYVDKQKFKEEKRSAVYPGDIVMAKIGARCGASAILPTGHDVGILSGNALKISVDTSRHSTYYVWQVLWSLYASGRMDELRSVGAQPAISMPALKKYKIPLPPLLEQCEIAQALSDTDDLIAALERLITKKRNLKHAAMQQLLSGRTRLPGFESTWYPTSLEDLLRYEQPTRYLVATTDYSSNGSIPVLTPGKTFLLGYTAEKRGIYRSIPVIIFDDFTTSSRYVDFPFKLKSSAVKILTARPAAADLRWAYERMQLVEFASGSDHKRRWISQYRHLRVAAPEPAEQRAIAAVLSDMDAEIATLKAHRDKTRLLKQGMMQELLTGRTRLV